MKGPACLQNPHTLRDQEVTSRYSRSASKSFRLSAFAAKAQQGASRGPAGTPKPPMAEGIKKFLKQTIWLCCSLEEKLLSSLGSCGIFCCGIETPPSCGVQAQECDRLR